MTRIWLCFIMLAMAGPAWAGEDAPYYGPMKRWHGIGYKLGYEDRINTDGSWRIDTAIRGRGEAVDMALYRAAERARAEGYRYVFLLGGRRSSTPGVTTATLFARPSHAPVPPVDCRSTKKTRCYTADVAEVLRILGGPGGTQPGVAIVDHRDELGREVRISGYGIGAVAILGPGGAPLYLASASHPIARTPTPVAGFVAAPIPVSRITRPADTAPIAAPMPAPMTTSERFEQALKEIQPIRGGDPKQGWTVSD